jgi:hypothetical protein
MNNWENVLAFASVCKSWKDVTDQYRLKIGVELIEGGDGRKLNVSGFLSYLDQEKFWLAEMICVPYGNVDKLFYCDVKVKFPRMRLLIGISVPIPPLIASQFPRAPTTLTTFNMPLPQNHFRVFLGIFFLP